VAQNKTVVVNEQTIVLGGSYDKEKKKLLLTANGDAIMQGRFPPMTPTQNLNANFEDMKFKGDCYFGSVIKVDALVLLLALYNRQNRARQISATSLSMAPSKKPCTFNQTH
jgi:hypothetical protein